MSAIVISGECFCELLYLFFVVVFSKSAVMQFNIEQAQ